jgi:hypothetical protein
MRHFILALLFVAGAEAAAIACTCIMPPTDAAERQQLARDVAAGAVALVEVELASPYDARTGRGERLRVRRTLAGRAPATIELERDRIPSSAACDLEFSRRGQRALVLLYPPRHAAGSATPRFRPADSCLTYLLGDMPFRTALVSEMTSPTPRPVPVR